MCSNFWSINLPLHPTGWQMNVRTLWTSMDDARSFLPYIVVDESVMNSMQNSTCITRKNCDRINKKSTENRWSWLLFRSRWPGHSSTEGCWSVSVDLVTQTKKSFFHGPTISGIFFFTARISREKIIFRLPGYQWQPNPIHLGLQG